MAKVDPDTRTWVTRHETISKAIGYLLSRRIHQHFIAYLYLHKLAATTDASSQILPRWGELGEYLRIDGGPTPYLRPFWPQRRSSGQEWLNQNIAGSFAPSSLRAEGPLLKVVDLSSDGSFSLREGHAALAYEHLLFREKLDVIYLSLFLHRNYGYIATTIPTHPDIVSCFCHDFGYLSDRDELFMALYSVQADYDTADWFVPWHSGDGS